MTDDQPEPTAPMPSAPGPGSVLAGRYKLEQRVGRGGMADVYRAVDELLHRAVAVKLFRLDGTEPNERLRIDAEMRTLAGLRHHGLVTLFDASATGDESSGNAPYLVMEFVEGGTLRDRLLDGPLPASEAAVLGAELAASLAYVHANGVVHRDVKPANILLDEGPRGAGEGLSGARLTDFGIARLTDDARLTQHGNTVGTANYLSPEQATGQPVGAPSDVYSLGLVLMECLTGQLAYPGTGVQAAVARLHRAPEIPTRFGPQWAALLEAMTAHDAAARPDAARVATELGVLTGPAADRTEVLGRQVLGAAPVPGSTQLLPGLAASGPVTAPRPPGQDRRYGLIAAAVVGVLVLALALTVGLNSGSDTTAGSASTVATYPAVPGSLGTELRALEKTVGLDSPAAVQLQKDTRAVATAAAARRWHDALAAVQILQSQTADDANQGTLTSSQAAAIKAAALVVENHVALLKSPTPTPASSTPRSTTGPPPTVKPAPHHKKKGRPGKGQGQQNEGD